MVDIDNDNHDINDDNDGDNDDKGGAEWLRG